MGRPWRGAPDVVGVRSRVRSNGTEQLDVRKKRLEKGLLVVAHLLHGLGHLDRELCIGERANAVPWQDVLEDGRKGEHREARYLHACTDVSPGQ